MLSKYESQQAVKQDRDSFRSTLVELVLEFLEIICFTTSYMIRLNYHCYHRCRVRSVFGLDLGSEIIRGLDTYTHLINDFE